MYVVVKMTSPDSSQVGITYNEFSSEWNVVESMGGISSVKTKLMSNIVSVCKDALVNLPSTGSFEYVWLIILGLTTVLLGSCGVVYIRLRKV